MMSTWHKLLKIVPGVFIRAMVMLVAVMLAGCAKPHVRYAVVHPDVHTLRNDHIGLLQKSGAQVVSQGQTVRIFLPSDALFASRSANLIQSAIPILQRVAGLLPLYNTETVQVASYSDNQASKRFLRLLTERQAQVVSEYLWPHKLDAAMIYARGYGAGNPIASNASIAGQRVNRRVVISLRYFPVLKTYN